MSGTSVTPEASQAVDGTRSTQCRKRGVTRCVSVYTEEPGRGPQSRRVRPHEAQSGVEPVSVGAGAQSL